MLTFHVLVNVGMTAGIMPVTGIPLPLMKLWCKFPRLPNGEYWYSVEHLYATTEDPFLLSCSVNMANKDAQSRLVHLYVILLPL